jgi:hypothetical protein
MSSRCDDCAHTRIAYNGAGHIWAIFPITGSSLFRNSAAAASIYQTDAAVCTSASDAALEEAILRSLRSADRIRAPAIENDRGEG